MAKAAKETSINKKKSQKDDKVQSREMEKAIERSKDISEAWLQGGKAIGHILKPKKKRK